MASRTSTCGRSWRHVQQRVPWWLGSALIAGPMLPGVCRAVDASWKFNISGNWSTAFNWTTSPLIPNGVGDQAKFIEAAQATLTITQDVPGLTLGAMQFNNGHTYRIVGANPITMDNIAPNAGLTVGGSLGHGAHLIATNVVLTDRLFVTQSSLGEFTFSGAVSGGGGLTKSGNGSLYLTGTAANTFIGDTRFNAGTLRLFKSVNANAIGGNLIVGDDFGGANADVATIANNALPTTCDVTINSSGQLQVLSGDAVQHLSMKSGSITIGGGGSSLLITGQVQTTAHADPATISGPGRVELFGGTKIITVADGAAASDLIVSAPITIGGIDKRGSGTMVLSGNNLYQGPTLVGQGKLVLGASMTRSAQWTIEDAADAMLSAGGAKVIKNTTLAINGSGALDLTDNKLITGSAIGTWNGSNYTGVAGLVSSGRSGGDWTGGGIVTSDPRAISGLVSIGVATVAQIKNITSTATETFAGQTVLGSDTIAMVTWGGDANLDGTINIDDYGRIDSQIGTPGANGWFNGDFNYDGKINIDDYGIIDSNISQQGATFATTAAIASPTAVPEPAAALVAASLLGGLISRRRR